MTNKPKTRNKDFLEAVSNKFGYDREKGSIFNKETGVYQNGLIANRYKGCNVYVNGKGNSVRVHHVVWFFEYGYWPDKQIDHIDGDKLNNHYTNLRLCEGRQNMAYYYQEKETSSKYVGVRYRKDRDIYSAKAYANKKRIYLKESKSEEVCARAYDDFLVSIGLDRVNFPD